MLGICFVEVFGNDFKLCPMRASVIMFATSFMQFSKKQLLYLYIKCINILHVYHLISVYYMCIIYIYIY